jgi:hypothetical protein
VSILYRYAKNAGLVKAVNTASLASFSDMKDVAAWSKDAMAWAVSAGILKGGTGNTLSPQGTATRAQVATIIKRFVDFTENAK